ncbi:hypothetical protein N478_15950 [Pseudoalteromonas luteoviolacea S4060-1]|uniref:Uncharacterized protein n=1 Tax=Pseudoalteromonas luteoviolacea S4060-1 TaxID=1365257 RepID=A0A167NEP2_9GAMM|nr:hypothetical protein N478_15950 [Pseudoalteromonas luteoviolacea S4060-1]
MVVSYFDHTTQSHLSLAGGFYLLTQLLRYAKQLTALIAKHAQQRHPQKSPT